jgi:protein tyrosine/serine phosphatase
MFSRRSTFLVIAIITLAIGFTISWYAGLRNRFEPVNFGIVEPGKLFRSGQISQHVVRQTLAKNRIGVIINLTGDDTADGKAEDMAARDMGLKRVRLSLGGDGLGDPAVYPKALAEIVRANHDGKAVLVHCQSGAQRTGGVIATYRSIVEGQSTDEAFAEMREYGHDPGHNPLLIPFILQHLPEWKNQFDKYQNDPATAPATQPTS